MDIYKTSTTLVKQTAPSLALRRPVQRCLYASGNASLRSRNFTTTTGKRQAASDISHIASALPSKSNSNSKPSTPKINKLGPLLRDSFNPQNFTDNPDLPSRKERESTGRKPRDESSVGAILDSIRLRGTGRNSTTNSLPRRDASSMDTTLRDFRMWGLSPSSNAPTPVTEETPFPHKLGPTLGRLVHVNKEKGRDIARAFSFLEYQCRVNRIKNDFFRQRFHERPGLRRKRLKSERWRLRFREGFKAVIRTVNAMKRQGW